MIQIGPHGGASYSTTELAQPVQSRTKNMYVKLFLPIASSPRPAARSERRAVMHPNVGLFPDSKNQFDLQ